MVMQYHSSKLKYNQLLEIYGEKERIDEVLLKDTARCPSSRTSTSTSESRTGGCRDETWDPSASNRHRRVDSADYPHFNINKWKQARSKWQSQLILPTRPPAIPKWHNQRAKRAGNCGIEEKGGQQPGDAGNPGKGSRCACIQVFKFSDIPPRRCISLLNWQLDAGA
ncbi:hypothetical protein HYALB_00012462 [Hymenoscyphus albidus]|uniref:Uncharacterized protein n=1 Tax=Hymenoscyphus albidus TaxID=595503 RepID=A0A9N9LPI3_9HELO|nr:hypothetical protein HYALB_00012462 [Hymenoscyphus albidus]